MATGASSYSDCTSFRRGLIMASATPTAYGQGDRISLRGGYSLVERHAPPLVWTTCTACCESLPSNQTPAAPRPHGRYDRLATSCIALLTAATRLPSATRRCTACMYGYITVSASRNGTHPRTRRYTAPVPCPRWACAPRACLQKSIPWAAVISSSARMRSTLSRIARALSAAVQPMLT